MKTIPDDSVSPIFNSNGFATHRSNTKYEQLTGLTKREYFAAMAMQGMFAALAHPQSSGYSTYIDLPKHAVEFADALINELNK